MSSTPHRRGSLSAGVQKVRHKERRAESVAQKRSPTHKELRGWLVGANAGNQGAERWGDFQSSLVDDAAKASSLERLSEDLEHFGVAAHAIDGAEVEDHQPSPGAGFTGRKSREVLSSSESSANNSSFRETGRPHTSHGNALPSSTDPSNVYTYTDRFGNSNSRPKSFFSASPTSTSGGLPTLLTQVRGEATDRPRTSPGFKYGARLGTARSSTSKLLKKRRTATPGSVYSGVTQRSSGNSVRSLSEIRSSEVTFKVSDTAGGAMWKQWFKKQRTQFRSFAVRMEVAMEEARREQENVRSQQASSSDGHNTSQEGTGQTAGSPTPFMPTWATTKLLVEHLHALASAPGEFGEMQRFINQELFRCIFFDFVAPVNSNKPNPHRQSCDPTFTPGSVNSRNQNIESAAAHGDVGGEMVKLSSASRAVHRPTACRRAYFEMVFLLQARLARLQARVRFFLIASQETGTSSRKLGQRLVFNAWRAHTEKMRRLLISKLKRRMLGIWWKRWRSWQADQHMVSRIDKLLKELKMSINVNKLLHNAPTLTQLITKPDASGDLLFPADQIAEAVFTFVNRALTEVMDDSDAAGVVDMTDMHSSPAWIGRLSMADIWTAVLAAPKSTDVASTQTATMKDSFGTQTLRSLEGYAGGVSRAGNSHGPQGNEFHADVSRRIFPIAGGVMQSLQSGEVLRHTLNPLDTPVRPGAYEEKVVCQICDILGRKAEANYMADRTGQSRPMLPEFLDRYFLNAHGDTMTAEMACERFFSDCRIFAGNRLVYWFSVIAGIVQHNKAPITHSTPLCDFIISALQRLGQFPDVLHLFSTSGFIHRKEAIHGARQVLLGMLHRRAWDRVASELQRGMESGGQHIGTMHCNTWLHVVVKTWAQHFSRNYAKMMNMATVDEEGTLARREVSKLKKTRPTSSKSVEDPFFSGFESVIESDSDADLSDCISNPTSPKRYTSLMRQRSRKIMTSHAEEGPSKMTSTTTTSTSVGTGTNTPTSASTGVGSSRWDATDQVQHIDVEEHDMHTASRHFQLLVGLFAPDLPSSWTRPYASKIHLDPQVPGQFQQFRDKVSKLVPWMRKAYYQKHPITGSESLRSHLVDTFVSYSLFGCKAGHLPNREDICMHLPRFFKFFEDCQLVYGHVTHELLRTVFDETMKSNNDDGSWVGSPRNPQNAPVRTRQLSRSSYSSKNLLGQVTNTVGPDFTRDDLSFKAGSGVAVNSSSDPPNTLNRRDSASGSAAGGVSRRARSDSADPVFGEVQFLNWESFLWAFFKIARSQGLTVDSMTRNALTNHPHGSIPRTLTHPVSPVILPQEELDTECRHVFEHYRVDGTHTDSLRFPEVQKFLLECGLVELTTAKATILRIFGVSDVGETSFQQFQELLVAASRYIELDVPVVTQYCIEQVHALEQSFTDQHRRLLEVHVESGKESASLPLVKAALHNDVLDCAARLAHGDSPLEIDPECGMSALHAAALHGDDTLMSILLNHSDVTPEVLRNHVTINGQSVLDIVLSHKNREAGIRLACFMGLNAFEEAAADGKLGSRAYLREVFEGVRRQRVVAKRMDLIQAILRQMHKCENLLAGDTGAVRQTELLGGSPGSRPVSSQHRSHRVREGAKSASPSRDETKTAKHDEAHEGSSDEDEFVHHSDDEDLGAMHPLQYAAQVFAELMDEEPGTMRVAESVFVDTANVVFSEEYAADWHSVKSAAFEEHGEHGLAEGLTGKGAGRPLDTDMVFLILQKIVEASAQSHRRGGLMGSKVNPSTGRGGAGRQRKGSTQDELFQHYEELGHIHKGKSRMTIAAQTGDVDATRLFLSHGDDVNERDTNYSTPIIHLAWNGHLAVAKVLVEHKADVNAQNLRKNTALHFAYEQNHEKLAIFLQENGARMTKNTMGKTPRMLNLKLHKKIKNGKLHLKVLQVLHDNPILDKIFEFFDQKQSSDTVGTLVRAIFHAFDVRPDATLSAALTDEIMAAVIKHDRSIGPFYKRVLAKRTSDGKGCKKGKLTKPVNFSDMAGLLGELHTSMHKD